MVDKQNYNHMYTAALTSNDTPEDIFKRFNIDRPADFTGHSPSISDIIVLHQNGEVTAYYVNPVGFVQVPEFLEEPYKYYSTQRPVDIGTFPKAENTPIKIVNFDKRKWVENATFRAWGYIIYNAPLTKEQMDDYDLKAAGDNINNVQLSPYQLEAQTQVIGKWEQSDISIKLWISEEEQDIIRERMEELSTENMSAFIRKMALNGYILNIDLSPVKELVSLQRYCSNNLNQIAIGINTYGGIQPHEIKTLQKDYEALWTPLSDLLKQLVKITKM
jgi:hypothetical protein